jgi:hypothetical protein
MLVWKWWDRISTSASLHCLRFVIVAALLVVGSIDLPLNFALILGSALGLLFEGRR